MCTMQSLTVIYCTVHQLFVNVTCQLIVQLLLLARYRDRSVLSYHYYCWILDTNTSIPYVPWKRIACDGLLGPRVRP